MLVKIFYILDSIFLENQLRPKEYSPKPKEKKVIIKTQENVRLRQKT